MLKLPILGKVQEIETRLANLKQGIEQTENRPELVALKKELNKLKHDLLKARDERSGAQQTQRQLGLEIKSCQERLDAVDKKLYGGGVSSSRELEQLQQKAEEYRLSKRQFEEQLLQVMVRDEELAKAIKEIEATGRSRTGQRNVLQEEIRLEMAQVELEMADLQDEVDGLLPQVPPEWVARYRRIAQAHNGIGISKVKTGNCGACHVKLSDSLLQQLKRAEDQLIFCENCGRILYF